MDRFKSLFAGQAAAPAPALESRRFSSGATLHQEHPPSPPVSHTWPKGYPSEETSHTGRALEQFLTVLSERGASSILDLGGANQANVNFITSLGHRMSSESVLYSLDTVWNDPNLSEARKIEDFLEQTLNYQHATFGGVLAWDMLQFLPQPLLEAALSRLRDVLEQGAPLLAYFHADEKTPVVPNYAYRISDPRTVLLTPKSLRNRAQFLNSRAVENLFQHFKSVKFYLTRDHLREVLVIR